MYPLNNMFWSKRVRKKRKKKKEKKKPQTIFKEKREKIDERQTRASGSYLMDLLTSF